MLRALPSRCSGMSTKGCPTGAEQGSEAQRGRPAWKWRSVTSQDRVVTEARVGWWAGLTWSLVPLAHSTPPPSSPPTGAGRADPPPHRFCFQHQCAHGQPVLELHQPWAGGAHGHVEPFSIELGGSTALRIWICLRP